MVCTILNVPAKRRVCLFPVSSNVFAEAILRWSVKNPVAAAKLSQPKYFRSLSLASKKFELLTTFNTITLLSTLFRFTNKTQSRLCGVFMSLWCNVLMWKHHKQLKAKYFLDPVLLPFSIPKFPEVLNFKNFKQHKCDGWKILFLLLNIFCFVDVFNNPQFIKLSLLAGKALMPPLCSPVSRPWCY